MPKVIAQTVLELPGGLDDVPVFHSNSPELVLEAGILLSTFPESGKRFPHAHLNYAADGKFALFFHHSTDSTKTSKPTTLYLGVLIGNASKRAVTLHRTGGASYATKPDAPFMVLDAVLSNDNKSHYAGPGDRVALDLLTELSKAELSPITLEPGETKLFQSFALPKGFILAPLNGRTGLFHFDCDGPVNLAVVAVFAEPGFLSEKPPTAEQYLKMLQDGNLVTPRDKTPTVPGASGELIYGRVAGVAQGASWKGTIVNNDSQSEFLISADQIISFPLSTVIGGTLGSEQVQSAPLLCRYPDTAYQSHGNYGVTYQLNLPIRNTDAMPISLKFALQSPLKNSNQADSLNFLAQSQRIVFRGTVKFSWTDSLSGQNETRLIHLVQTQGMVGTTLLELNVAPGTLQIVEFSLSYPADCTPPHVLTIKT